MNLITVKPMLTDNIFMKNNYIFQNKNNLVKRVASLNIFAVPLISKL